ncbi:MAG TPA: lamin tail domain-containing protein [Bacteroidales bacterium]|nr:lamin tail domain-containing protein [Bacteroidales bacterium]HPT02635.1 lamin tail domain-containing protein [Bacteroidales bacterium]
MRKFTLFAVTVTVFLFFGFLKVGNSQVVISQMYGGGGNSGSTYTNDFIEIFNRGTSNVNLAGWSVQYASATGSSWQVTTLTAVSLAPGQYYLIQEAAGSGGSVPLPTPDVIGTIPMSGTNCKVALCNSSLVLTGACPTSGQIMDLVGTGTANCFEGSAASVAMSNTTSVIRASDGCQDSNDNSLDFSSSAPTPRNTLSPTHTCSTTAAALPTLDPGTGYYYSTQNVTITCATVGASIYYTIDGTDPNNTGNGTLYTSPVAISSTTTLKARAYATGYDPSSIASATYTFPTVVNTIAALRAGTPGEIYVYTGQGVLTFQQSYRHQKFIQDATAAILIDDNAGKITTTYAPGDAITNITGTVTEFNGMMEFTPEADPGAPASTGNTITPEEVSLGDLLGNWENYESELIKVPDVTFTSPSGNFANGTVYPVTDINGTSGNFRTTFYDVDYIGTPVPSAREDLVIIPNSRSDGDYITSRSLSDFTYNSSDNIVINEIMYNPPDAGNDTIEFIELYNKGVTDVNLNGWYFSQGIDYVFPDTTISAGDYFVIARNALSFDYTFGFTPAQWTSGILNNFGSEIEIKDAIGNVKDYVHYLPDLPWDTLANGHGPSLEICDPNADNSLPESWSASRVFAAVNTAGDSIFATPNARCGSGANLVITEIMYNPPESGTDTLEFIEIYNNGNSVNLEGFTFTEGVTLTFPSVDLPSGNYLVVAANAAAIQNTFGVSAIQWTSGALSNSGEAITLQDPYGYIIDQVTYDDQLPWDSIADGYGPSLTLCDPNSNNALAENWKASVELAAVNAAGDSVYATPGSGCVNPPAFANFTGYPTTLLEGEYVQFTDLSANNPISWEWSFPGGTPESSTEQNPNIRYNTFGVYPVTLTATNVYGSGTLTKTDYIHVDIDGIARIPSDAVRIYPNPAHEKVYVTNPTDKSINISVLSLLGSEVVSIKSAAEIIPVDMSRFPDGIYLVRLTTNDGKTITTQKLILK